MNLKKGQSNTITEWIVRIGIVVLLLGVLVSFLIYNIRYASPISQDTSKNFGDVLWKSLTSGDSGLVLIMTVVADILACTFVKYSLQGTTQGRYLTGGVLPVRFSM